MSPRAIILGLLLGLGISAGTYFNDFVIRQTMLIGNHLPISVFGVAMILLLALNPLLRLGGECWPLRPGELALLIAVALVACGWPGSGFYRGFASITAMPAHLTQVQPSWRAAGVMSYIPGGAPQLAPGHVRDWPALVDRLAESDLSTALDAQAWRQLRDLADARHVDLSRRQTGVRVLNQALIDPTSEQADPPLWQRHAEAGPLPPAARHAMAQREKALDKLEALRERGEEDTIAARSLRDEAGHWEQHANRAVLAMRFDGLVLPAPRGRGVLAAQGRLDEQATGALLHGEEGFSPGNVPWRHWWPVILTWGGAALLIGVASVALALIVHPQWSRHELLPYPIARFVEEITRQDQRSGLPALASNRMFWAGFAGLLALHVINGLHVWFPQVPEINTRLDFSAMRELFPNASRVRGSRAYFAPDIYPAVIAFAFFLTTAASFSLGISHLLYMLLGAALLARGISMEQSMIAADKPNLLRFGAFAAVALMILYTGRRYYTQVALGTLGLPGAGQVTRGASWAGRLLLLSVALCVLVLYQVGLPPLLATIFVLLVLMMLLVLARVVAETGAFFLQPWWMPVAVLTALFGVEAIGPTAFVLLAIASVMLVGDPREALMPYVTNGLQIIDRTGRTRSRRAVPWLLVMVIGGFVVAGLVTLTLQYQHGLAGVDHWTRQALPSMPFSLFTGQLSEMGAHDTLVEATWARGLERLELLSPTPGAWLWGGAGLALVLATALARLRLSWWPLHPVAFLVWGTYPIMMFAASFLLGWLIKLAVVKIGGAAAYRTVVPLMIGVIAGELTGGLLWIVVGGVYYAVTGMTPQSYSVFPG